MDPWLLDPAVTYLNHGSFGARARPVTAAQQAWRDLIERDPVAFVEEGYLPALDAARSRLAAFVGSDPAHLAFVANATSGVSAVLRSMEPRLSPGDEILQTDHGYNACVNAVEVTAGRIGAVPVTAPVPFPVASPDDVVEAVLSRVTARTRLLIVDLVTSPTGLILPVERLVSALEPEIPVLVDAAHGPGMLPLDIDRLGASFVTGNCHKWLCAPWGAAFLRVGDPWLESMVPPVVSHGWNTDYGGRPRFHALFDWTGTDDPTAWLSVPAAIDLGDALHPSGWPAIMGANHDLAVSARDLLAAKLGLDPPAPAGMIGSMAALALPGEVPARPGAPDPLTARLRAEHRIEVPVYGWRGLRLIRVSAHLYNDLSQYERLAAALTSML